MSDGATELERSLDELYGADPDEFVAERTRLARELRASGHRSEAKELGAARRPTKAAAALNQVARRAPERVERYLDRVRDVRSAPAGADASGDLRAAIHAQREALDALVAATVGDGAATEAVRNEIVQIVQGAAVDEAIADRLRHGRLVRAEAAAVDFTDLLAGPGVPAPPRRTSPRRSATRGSATRRSPRRPPRAAESAEATGTAAAEARAALERAQHDAEAADRAVDEAAATVVRLESELKAAKQQHRATERAATTARRVARDAAAALERLDPEAHRSGGDV